MGFPSRWKRGKGKKRGNMNSIENQSKMGWFDISTPKLTIYAPLHVFRQ